ncbi:ArsI/CadI family heavy metal resistance metalloenzyme, partial [Gordonia alkanivorans]
LKLVLLENPGQGGTINHLGVEVESSEKVHAEIARLSGEGLFTQEEINSTCCFATQDKVWVTGPANEKWEVYTVLADSDTFGTSPKLLEQNANDDVEQGSVCCGGSAAEPAEVRTACC